MKGYYMNTTSFGIGEMLSFLIKRLFNLLVVLYEIVMGVVKVGFIAALAYIISLIVFGLPFALIEAITKKKIPDKIQNRFHLIFTICLTIYFVYLLLVDEYPVLLQTIQ